jgi:hypothetical protein
MNTAADTLSAADTVNIVIAGMVHKEGRGLFGSIT